MRPRIPLALSACVLAITGAAALGTAHASATQRAVVVIEGGGSTHAFTTPWDACDGGRPMYVQALRDAGLPVFTAPGFTNTERSTAGETGCPPQPPVETQWNTAAYPTQAGESVLGFLGYLNATYGYREFDLVGYSYGGLVARATVAALKRPPAAASMAPAFSYAQGAAAGVRVPAITTLNSPHFGSPTYDIASDPTAYLLSVTRAWGKEFADAGKGLLVYQRGGGAGAIQVLATAGHARRNAKSWDARQAGVLDDVRLTLIAGDYCGRECVDGRAASRRATKAALRTDGTVPVYSQLMLPCPAACPTPPGAVYIPPRLLPAGTVRRTFPTLHSTFDSRRLGLPKGLSVSRNPPAIRFLVSTVVGAWNAAGVTVAAPPVA